ncbi:hypothetical protein CDL15_Pgr017327 [Punica granatum]|uniref:Reverse transcriptase domain-containing protein n=1 Tax=Punica granatum TaxID=22663 RepID=A0A218Y3K8_PUNGR|nr:hypothetical protein CDL15_Pgr017327 [Punica granatum]
MRRMCFRVRWLKWIQWCISTVRLSILVNGEPFDFFGSSRGIRHGDPFSPYLFILVMEALSKLLDRACDIGIISGLETSPSTSSELRISHLLYADDTILFCGDNDEELRNLRCVLLCFEAVYGLKINMERSEIVLVRSNYAAALADILDCKIGSFPLNYLGLPVGAGARNKDVWNVIIDRMERKLAGWKKMHLSKGARLTLIKASLSSLPTYFMSPFVIPKSVADRIEKIQRDFLWDSGENTCNFHLVKWSDVCQPLSSGGLGIRSLVNFSKALLWKWFWRFANERSALWRQVISSKFGASKSDWHTKVPSFFSGVSLWKPMLKFSPIFEMQVKFNAGEGDGRKINFWNDCWCGDQSLRTEFPSLFQVSLNEEVKVGDLYCYSNGVWNLSFSRNFYGFELLHSVSSFFSKIYSDFKRVEGPDSMYWKLMKSGMLSIKSYYDSLVDTGNSSFP